MAHKRIFVLESDKTDDPITATIVSDSLHTKEGLRVDLPLDSGNPPPPPPPELVKINPIGANASGDDGNIPQNVLNGDLNNRWSSRGINEWIELPFGRDAIVKQVKIAFYKGDQRQAFFEINGQDFTSSGTTNELQTFNILSEKQDNKIRINCKGNSNNEWNSITSIEVYGKLVGPIPPPPPPPDKELKAIINNKNQTVNVGDLVILNGNDALGPITNHAWTEVTNEQVVLRVNDDLDFSREFEALERFAGKTLKFTFTIFDKDGNFNSDEATVTVNSKPTEGLLLDVKFPNTTEVNKNTTIDCSGSQADTVTVNETSNTNTQLTEPSKWKFNFTPKEDTQGKTLGFKAEAKKGNSSSIKQVSIQVSSTSPIPNMDIDQHGIGWLEARGEKFIIGMTRDRDDDDRFSGNVTGLRDFVEATIIHKGTEITSDGHIAMKIFGGNHSGSGTSSNRWYDIGWNADGSLQLEWEGPHPRNHRFTLPDSKALIRHLGFKLDGNWLGIKWIVNKLKPNGSPSDGGVRVRMYIDRDPIDENGKPRNNWELAVDFIDGIDVEVIEPQTYKAPDEQDCEVRSSDTTRHDTFGDGRIYNNIKEDDPGLHVRRKGSSQNIASEILVANKSKGHTIKKSNK